MNKPSKNQVVNLRQKLSLFSDHWQPHVIAELNDYQFKITKLQGEFIWHSHADTDEAFFVIEGELKIDYRENDTIQSVTLGPGDLYVVPRGIEHRPIAEVECHLMLIEPRGVLNTGDTESDRTATNDIWI